jgi:Ulp1 family protease
VWGQCVERELCEFSLKDNLDKGKKRFGAVFNLDKHDQPGSHWVSLFISVDDAAIVFFDSALGGVPPEISTFVKRIQSEATILGKSLNFYTNTSEHQKGDTECGMYSIYFITEMLADFKNLDVFLKGRIDDNTVFNMRGEFYNKPL